jgi:hypothetical protein
MGVDIRSIKNMGIAKKKTPRTPLASIQSAPNNKCMMSSETNAKNTKRGVAKTQIVATT